MKGSESEKHYALARIEKRFHRHNNNCISLKIGESQKEWHSTNLANSDHYLQNYSCCWVNLDYTLRMKQPPYGLEILIITLYLVWGGCLFVCLLAVLVSFFETKSLCSPDYPGIHRLPLIHYVDQADLEPKGITV